ncbi:MAG: hypothetical protein CMJ83_11645 [Planctomycetes bacterium]|nr:hypothetical protein [Planctomycetota bacterium]
MTTGSMPWRSAVFALLALTLTTSAQTPEARVQTLEAKVAKLAKQLEQVTDAHREQADALAAMKTELVDARRQAVASDARVAQLETQVEHQGELDLATLIEEQINRLVDQGLGSESDSAIQWSGYFDLEFRDDNAGDVPNEFDHHRLILKLHSDITSEIAFDMELEIEGGGADVGRLTGNEIIVEFAELSFNITELFNLKTGVLLIPFNRYNLLHDSPLQDLTDRPLVDRRIIPTTWAEVGIGAYGAVHWDWGSLDYDIVLVNGLTDAISARGGTRGARGSYRSDNNANKMVVGRLGMIVDVSFLDVLGFGGSVAYGKYDDGNSEYLTMFGFDLTVKKGPFELVGEYAKLNLSRGPAERMAGIPGGMEGWYVEGRFHFFPDSWRGSSPFFTNQSTFTLVARYGEVDTDTSGTAVDFAANGDRYRDDRHRLTIGINFRPVEGTVIKFEYQWFFEPSGIPSVDNNRIVASFATYF